MKFAVKCVIWAAVVIPIAAVLVAVSVVYSGIYDIAANEPHFGVVGRVLTTLQENAVRRHAKGIVAPPLADTALVRRGLILYRALCADCHGSPGTERGLIGRGLNPAAARLEVEAADWTDAELFWITRNGLRLTGMPAFAIALEDGEIWAVVAYVRRQVRLTPREYAAMVRAVQTGGALPPDVQWVDGGDAGGALLAARGDPGRGKRLLGAYGCGACHVIPGIRQARGQAGPPLTRFAERHYIAGTLVNTPEALVAWIVNPQAIEPGTVMPTLGVTADEALDMAAYLFTLGEPPRALHTVHAGLNR
ncbi:MAG TPA: c-type cytochrome [Longimicrobiales bacterium]